MQVIALELADTEHATNDKADDKEQKQVGEQAVNAEHGEYCGIVAGEIAQVVVHATLDLTKIGGLGDALHIEELGDGSQVGEARGN